jgi:hypothetical protein
VYFHDIGIHGVLVDVPLLINLLNH